MVRGTLDQLEVEVREARGSTKQVTSEGVLLAPGEDFDGPLPFSVRRGAAVLGVHTDADTIAVYPQMAEGQITSKQLIGSAAEFDKFSAEEGGERFTATAFVLHLLPSIKGTAAHRRFNETLREMLAEDPEAA
jgi:hypothetical protein